jgi:hypothetical protein
MDPLGLPDEGQKFWSWLREEGVGVKGAVDTLLIPVSSTEHLGFWLSWEGHGLGFKTSR